MPFAVLPDDARTALVELLNRGPQPLFATVSGAHLYGFCSPDSDVDLRGAFVAPLKEVLRLRPFEDTRVVLGEVRGLELDWVAHDLSKFVGLMTRRNGYVLEQLTSPLVVHGGPWLDELRELGRGCMVRPLYFHYRGFLASQRKLLAKPTPTVKELLYAYRVALTGIYALRVGVIEANLPTLLREQAAPLDRLAVEALIERKVHGEEKGGISAEEVARHNPALDALDAALTEAHDRSKLPEEVSVWDGLDDYVVRARLALGA